MLDRLRIGAVVDFLDSHYAGWHWPTFNMADVAKQNMDYASLKSAIENAL